MGIVHLGYKYLCDSGSALWEWTRVAVSSNSIPLEGIASSARGVDPRAWAVRMSAERGVEWQLKESFGGVEWF